MNLDMCVSKHLVYLKVHAFINLTQRKILQYLFKSTLCHQFGVKYLFYINTNF